MRPPNLGAEAEDCQTVSVRVFLQATVMTTDGGGEECQKRSYESIQGTTYSSSLSGGVLFVFHFTHVAPFAAKDALERTIVCRHCQFLVMARIL